jgi:DNA gyrase inhibitor GyrI
MKKWIIMLLIATVLLAAVLWGPIVSNVEQARYEVVESHQAIEIRDYAPMIVAQVRVAGEREEAIGDGFRLVADYIFGNNVPASEIAMTAPVIQQPGETIAMTAPVTQQGGDGDWAVRFVMPAEYTIDTLPQPNNADVRLEEIAGKRFAVIRFSGRARADSLEEHTRKLEAFLRARNLQPRSQPAYAFYNPPWTLPFLRRNEVMIEIGR